MPLGINGLSYLQNSGGILPLHRFPREVINPGRRRLEDSAHKDGVAGLRGSQALAGRRPTRLREADRDSWRADLLLPHAPAACRAGPPLILAMIAICSVVAPGGCGSPAGLDQNLPLRLPG